MAPCLKKLINVDRFILQKNMDVAITKRLFSYFKLLTMYNYFRTSKLLHSITRNLIITDQWAIGVWILSDLHPPCNKLKKDLVWSGKCHIKNFQVNSMEKSVKITIGLETYIYLAYYIGAFCSDSNVVGSIKSGPLKNDSLTASVYTKNGKGFLLIWNNTR